MSKRESVVPVLLDLLVVKEGLAPKLSSNAEGKITYQLALSNDKKQIFIALVDSGSQGYFSREWINTDSILVILEGLGQRAEAFPSKVLQPVFVGRSSNNAPFLAAALLAEKLLGRDGKHETKLRVTDDGATWRKGVLTLKGKSIRVRLDGKPIVSTTQVSSPASEPSNEQRQIEEADHAADSPE
ncbi:hypothetical protein H7698_13790 [Pseudomonas sp. p50]|uniref:hypothetical protein n=1 Tax=Pseudomonas sp. p50(2008) TaxID=2816832 RepID=UPI00188C6781|nr:hypothetical protein [Pseudomonas sp. p50(2008)]MBF4557151.1 hypothetical protein [Pseudomonas sp. p50(2008)]